MSLSLNPCTSPSLPPADRSKKFPAFSLSLPHPLSLSLPPPFHPSWQFFGKGTAFPSGRALRRWIAVYVGEGAEVEGGMGGGVLLGCVKFILLYFLPSRSCLRFLLGFCLCMAFSVSKDQLRLPRSFCLLFEWRAVIY